MCEDPSFEGASQSLMQISGLGKLRPNLLLMGYKGDWNTCHREELRGYFNVIQLVCTKLFKRMEVTFEFDFSNALDRHMGVSILRLREGLDYSNVVVEDDSKDVKKVQSGITPQQRYNLMRLFQRVLLYYHVSCV
jgi:solute carrier family 12 (sodium/potassium/chloride transporter), member 2